MLAINTPVPNDTPLGLWQAPALPANASRAQRDFHDAARRAVTRIMERDFDDASVVLALHEELGAQTELAPLRSAWEQLLVAAARRAKLLAQAAPVLRLLRTAFQSAQRNPGGAYHNIDQAACRQAFATLFDLDTEVIDEQVTIPPLERMSLRNIDETCRTSHAAVLAGRSFPPVKGAPALRALARRLYTGTFPAAQVRKVSVPAGWKLARDGSRRSLTAIVGSKRERAFPEDPCVVEEVTIHQTRSGNRFDATECCDVLNSWAIACEQLE